MESKLSDADGLYNTIVKECSKNYRGQKATELHTPAKGEFNMFYRVDFDSGRGASIRFPLPSYFDYLEEKLLAEVDTLRYIKANTDIKVPKIHHWGSRDNSPGQLGPFIVMDWMFHETNFTEFLNKPNVSPYQPVLNPAIEDAQLRRCYEDMADVLLKLSRCEFSAIGSLVHRDGTALPTVGTRPMTVNLAYLANIARVPHSCLPARHETFRSASRYYSALADMHLLQLSFQRNQAIESADDCRKKYIARQLFRKLASEGRLANTEFEYGPFKLWCDELGLMNAVLGPNKRVTGIVDWEFSYAAPAEFSFSPPWWLILTPPEKWEQGLDDWVAHYEPKLAMFLEELSKKEERLIDREELSEHDALSPRMRKSWETGQFWVDYAARRSWAFDGIYWRFLDEKFFGKNESGDFKERLKLLSPEQIEAMEELVKRKLREKEESCIVDWYAPGTDIKMPPDLLNIPGLGVTSGPSPASDPSPKL
ncbi:hypothetical protein B0I35DRAFT_453545 [Stachybotrys elegans]|uniref:Aminoglycoside phosphotransferase domain-containing protein n=1 Tax=Stachybotrys elegans TaxID=80388 RepID=A0A8K0SIY2_9HYPO|nr:hypothetical protein B0I35DRAFT_453545 [Stachybotrys elegans]